MIPDPGPHIPVPPFWNTILLLKMYETSPYATCKFSGKNNGIGQD